MDQYDDEFIEETPSTDELTAEEETDKDDAPRKRGRKRAKEITVSLDFDTNEELAQLRAEVRELIRELGWGLKDKTVFFKRHGMQDEIITIMAKQRLEYLKQLLEEEVGIVKEQSASSFIDSGKSDAQNVA